MRSGAGHLPCDSGHVGERDPVLLNVQLAEISGVPMPNFFFLVIFGKLGFTHDCLN